MKIKIYQDGVVDIDTSVEPEPAGENFVVHLAGENLTADKTFGEIAEEFAKGGLVVFDQPGSDIPVRGYFSICFADGNGFDAAIVYPATPHMILRPCMNGPSERNATDYPYFSKPVEIA